MIIEWTKGDHEWTARAGDLMLRVWRADVGDWLWDVEAQGADLAWQIIAGYDVGHVRPALAAQACEDALVAWLASTARAVGCSVGDHRRGILARRARRAQEAELYERMKDSIHWAGDERSIQVKYRGLILTVERTAGEIDPFYANIMDDKNHCHGEAFYDTQHEAQAGTVARAHEVADRIEKERQDKIAWGLADQQRRAKIKEDKKAARS